MQTVTTTETSVPVGALLERKQLFLIDMIPIRAKKLGAALNSLYEVQVFSDGGAALEAMHQDSPHVVVIDERTLSSQGQGILRTKARSENIKHIPFIILSDGTEGPLLLGDGEGAADHFLKRPFTFNQLLEQISYSLSQGAERSWTQLPLAAQKTLQGTVDQFKSISKAIAEGQPIDLTDTRKSCAPLVTCIQSNQCKGVLDGLRDHHNYTYVHSLRVATFLTLFGKAIGMGKEEMLVLSMGGLLHDVGKVATPQNILNKHGKLNDEEWDMMRGHVTHSQDILSNMPDVNPIIRIIAEQHHEKLDGTGYPKGLKNGELNELARMAAIVDIFSALTDRRSYKVAYCASIAFKMIEQMGPALDQRLVRTFRDTLSGGDYA